MSNSLQPRGLKQVRFSCPSLSPGLLTLMSIELVMPSNHLILCQPLPLLPSIFPSIRGSPGGSDGKESARSAGDLHSIPGSGSIPWRTEWQPTPVFLHGEFYGQRSLKGYSPWGHRVRHNWGTNTSHSKILLVLKFSVLPKPKEKYKRT